MSIVFYNMNICSYFFFVICTYFWNLKTEYHLTLIFLSNLWPRKPNHARYYLTLSLIQYRTQGTNKNLFLRWQHLIKAGTLPVPSLLTLHVPPIIKVTKFFVAMSFLLSDWYRRTKPGVGWLDFRSSSPCHTGTERGINWLCAI